MVSSVLAAAASFSAFGTFTTSRPISPSRGAQSCGIPNRSRGTKRINLPSGCRAGFGFGLPLLRLAEMDRGSTTADADADVDAAAATACCPPVADMSETTTLSYTSPFLSAQDDEDEDAVIIPSALIILNSPMRTSSRIFRYLWEKSAYRICADGEFWCYRTTFTYKYIHINANEYADLL